MLFWKNNKDKEELRKEFSANMSVMLKIIAENNDRLEKKINDLTARMMLLDGFIFGNPYTRKN